jgi:hypothetical protein
MLFWDLTQTPYPPLVTPETSRRYPTLNKKKTSFDVPIFMVFWDTFKAVIFCLCLPNQGVLMSSTRYQLNVDPLNRFYWIIMGGLFAVP